jgi:fructokinase
MHKAIHTHEAPRSPERTAAAAQTVVIFGETLVDRFRDRSVLGGAPFNVACHLGAFGAHPVLVTRTGKDVAGEQLLQAMAERGLDLRGVQRDPVRPTGQVLVSEHAGGHAFDILPDQAYDHIHPGLARMVGLSVHPALVYFGTLSQRDDSRRALRELLGAVDCGAFLDVNLRDPWVEADTVAWSLQRADVAKLNREELERIADSFGLDGDTPRARAGALLARFGLERVVVTCGGDGAWSLDTAGRFSEVAGTPLEAMVDSVGAGDAFAAVFILGRLRRWSLAQRLARADAFARAICGVRGAVPPPDFYEPFIRDWKLAKEVAHA